MAKDNLPFHTIVWPATVIGTGEPWTMASYIKGFNWLTYYGGKFSTSQKRGVFMNDALDIYPADYWRYFLLSLSPESDDSDFTWEIFASTVNKDLAGNFGNFVNRTLKLTAAQLGPSIPDGGQPGEMEARLEVDCRSAMDDYRECLSRMEFRKAVLALKRLWSLGNSYIDTRAPWNLLKADRDEAAMVLRTCINLVRVFALASEPIIPYAAETVMSALGLTHYERQAKLADAADLTALSAGRPFEVPPPLFARVQSADIASLTERFGGTGPA